MLVVAFYLWEHSYIVICNGTKGDIIKVQFSSISGSTVQFAALTYASNVLMQNNKTKFLCAMIFRPSLYIYRHEPFIMNVGQNRWLFLFNRFKGIRVVVKIDEVVKYSKELQIKQMLTGKHKMTCKGPNTCVPS